MLRTFLTGKIHRATVTAADINYVGSITVDPVLLAAAGMIAYEQVHVVNITNGQRLITYAIAGSDQSGVISLNGAAARLAMPGDRVIILAYGLLMPQEVAYHRPRVVFVDKHNRILEATTLALDDVALEE